ncbi:MAG TPA: TolC family protein, partial [Planctomycetota bacterium]|nr:TolC family protein [Planctomycetota bacterium]
MRSFAFLFPFLVPACVAYHAAPVDLDETARELDKRAVEEVDVAAATGFAYAHNPELLKLRSEARAAGLDVPPATVGAGADSLEEKIKAGVDPLEIANAGTRGAATKAAGAREVEMLAALREEERRVAAAIAECFLVEGVLAARALPAEAPDPRAFARAGLASDAAAAQARSAREARAAEELATSAERVKNLARLRRLMGLSADAPLALTLPPAPFPSLPEWGRERLLARPDLAVALARYGTADAEFREAVWRQYPSLDIGPAFRWSGNSWGGFVELRVPVGASRQARAAEERREAARRSVEAALLAAEEEARAREADLRAAAAKAHAAEAEADAARMGLDASLARLEVDGDAF